MIGAASAHCISHASAMARKPRITAGAAGAVGIDAHKDRPGVVPEPRPPPARRRAEGGLFRGRRPRRVIGGAGRPLGGGRRDHRGTPRRRRDGDVAPGAGCRAWQARNWLLALPAHRRRRDVSEG